MGELDKYGDFFSTKQELDEFFNFSPKERVDFIVAKHDELAKKGIRLRITLPVMEMFCRCWIVDQRLKKREDAKVVMGYVSGVRANVSAVYTWLVESGDIPLYDSDVMRIAVGEDGKEYVEDGTCVFFQDEKAAKEYLEMQLEIAEDDGRFDE